MSVIREMQTENRVKVRLHGDFVCEEQAQQAVLQAMQDIFRAQQVASEPLTHDTTSLPEQNQKEE